MYFGAKCVTVSADRDVFLRIVSGYQPLRFQLLPQPSSQNMPARHDLVTFLTVFTLQPLRPLVSYCTSLSLGIDECQG
jgi:hypothetical protein